jgi:hypothetical protein
MFRLIWFEAFCRVKMFCWAEAYFYLASCFLCPGLQTWRTLNSCAVMTLGLLLIERPGLLPLNSKKNI